MNITAISNMPGWRAICVVALMGFGPLASHGQAAAPKPRAGNPVARRLTVTGQGDVKAQPDQAEITLGVVTEDPASKAAAAANAAAAQKIQSAVLGLGIAKRDIQTTNYSVQPIYTPEQTGPNGTPRPTAITSYRVTNQVRITVRDLSRLGEIIDAATAAGSNSVDNIAFGMQDPTVLERQALRKAVANARDKADQIAAAAGVRIVGIYELNEGGIQRPYPMAFSRAAESAPTPINPGETTVTATVTIVYEMNDGLRPSRR